jgi:ATP-dependent DNA helicase RecQ
MCLLYKAIIELKNIIVNEVISVGNQPAGVLHSVFGYETFRDQQQAIIQQLIDGHDVLVLMPTGGGKSLCYQLPAIIRDGVGIVISPLIALMQDQVNALHQLGVKAAFLNSTLSLEEVQQTEQQLLNNELDLLYIAPERLISARTASLFEHLKIALFAIDEAHCVSQWGHDFRVDYLRLSLLHERFPDIPRIALTATADERTRQEIIQRLNLGDAKHFISGFDRPNIRYRIVQKQSAREQLLNFIQNEHAGDAGIVYCLSRKKVDATAEWLNNKGIAALPYHAGMGASQRQQNQHRFLMEEGLILVATIAFGMGIDKPNVRFVAHLDLPKTIEAYYQETGRAGRDGLPANAWMVYGLQDVVTLRQMLEGSNADETHKRVELHKLDSMLGLCEQVSCRRQALLAYFGDHLEQPCGNCDTCLEPVETWDGTLAAQQALSCIHRTGQRFGVNYLLDVLLGKATERVKSFGHDQLSTFALGKDLDEFQWRSVFRQLVARRLATVDLEGYGGLRLSEQCRPVLRGEQQVMLRKDIKIQKTKRSQNKKGLAKVKNNEFWEALRTKRKEIADAQDVPTFIIFHDATLMAMMEEIPVSLQQFAQLSGVGERKLELYAEDFLEVINQYKDYKSVQQDNDLSETVVESLDLFRSGQSVEKIAEQRDLKITTIYSHLSDALALGQVRLNEVIKLSETEIKEIEDTIHSLPDDQKEALKPVYEALNGAYDYGVIRCVRAALQNETK